jgi:hypothetical protein
VLSPQDITSTTGETFDASKQLFDLTWILMVFRGPMKIRAKLHIAGEQTIYVLIALTTYVKKYLEGRIINKRLSHLLRTRARR